jgi:hypothetical protein
MAKHAKPKERIRDWPLTERGQTVVGYLVVTAIFAAIIFISGLVEMIG